MLYSLYYLGEIAYGVLDTVGLLGEYTGYYAVRSVSF
jgi:hypothetical protein